MSRTPLQRRSEIRKKSLGSLNSEYSVLSAKLKEATSRLNESLEMSVQMSEGKGGNVSSYLREASRSVTNAIQRLNLAQENIRSGADEKIERHEVLNSKIFEALESLVAASALAETLDGKSKTGPAAELGVNRRLRLRETVRIVNAARQHISKLHSSSLSLSRALKEFVENSPEDLWNVFE